MDELAAKSKKRIYQTDYLAWASDVLGRNYYQKMQEIAVAITHPTNGKTRTAVKSANGCGKSFILSDIGTWWVTAFPPEESLAIFTANGRDQIQNVVFKYLKNNYGYMATQARAGKGSPPIGWISEQLEWNYSKPDGSGKEAIAFGKRPADSDIVSSFQGTRKRRTFVGLDEMGGLPQDILTAAEAVATGAQSTIAGIGNPDRRGTMFYDVFKSDRMRAEWNTFTISAYDLPSMTGEVVYPDNPEMEAIMLDGLTSAEWIAHKERVWKTGGEIVEDSKLVDPKTGLPLKRNPTGKPDARFLAKVLGEFPAATDTAFFPEEDIDFAREVTIDPQGQEIVLGVDVAAMGADESVVMVNQGGRCRVFDKEIAYDDGGERRTTTGTWAKEDEVTSARRVHAIAKHLGATEVRLDGSGLGGGIASMLERLDEFNDKTYVFIRVMGAASSADKDRWERARDENHDQLRELLHDHKLDIDYDDVALRDQLLAVTYELNNRGAVKIAKKSDMRSEMHGSPDRLDALIYATISTKALLDTQAVQKGDIVLQDPWAMLNAVRNAPGMPI
jgi:hypothetical protein